MYRIENRCGLRIGVVVEGDEQSSRLVFVMHGLTGSKDQPHIVGMREAFADAGFTVVAFDTTHSWGDSDGDSIHATATSYLHDLADVIDWAQTRPWFKQPFVLAGHSLGGISSLMYARQHREAVSGLFPMSTAISGKLYRETLDSDFVNDWKTNGSYFKQSKSLPGKSGYVGWNFLVDLDRYNALEAAPAITCPVLLLVGSKDNPAHQRMLYEKLDGLKELHVIDGMEHTPTTRQEIDTMKTILTVWIQRTLVAD